MEIKNVEKQRTLMVRTTAAAGDLPVLMEKVYQDIAVFAGTNGVALAGPPYARYYNMDMEALDIEMGFPVAGEPGGVRDIQCGEIPEGKIAAAIHTGPYSKLDETYHKLMEFVQKQGLKTHEWMYEFYLNSPLEVKEEELQTEICYPLVQS